MSERKMTDNEYTLNIDPIYSGTIIAAPIDPGLLVFHKPNNTEIMRIDKEGMVFMGQRITDAGEAYEAWMKTMAMMQENKDEDKKLLAYKMLVESLEARIASHEKTRLSYQEARDTLESERECNAILTEELEGQESSDEPVAWLGRCGCRGLCDEELYFDKQAAIDDGHDFIEPLYRHPPRARKLTDKTIDDVINKHRFAYGVDANAYTFARAIERRINGEEE